ncbi:Crp/Fnr family transcriptional regulator [Mucilaginibacter aquatilis]|uniref:Cyclic nucleotide-binding domain-containing protein n=1 Tax=Mucilaginibacter aquatilis TaxID=1517760 RepID=A0A6I4I5D0_9SPHI|nr:Crp/Fnr family transcriptional regulator [Mucilaginibacter aquatilis]MVN90321.1 cyclic nucleotide-binding domain-containing protein [Mucilaginibacter aquatilis]
MFDILLSHISEKVTLNEQEKALMQNYFVPKRLRKRQYLLQEGNVCRNLAFVSKGLLRTYNVDDKGDEHMSIFGWEGWWISDFNSFLTGVPAVFNIDAIEDSEVLLLSRENYEAITLAIPMMDRYFRILYQNSLVTKERRLMSSVTDTAEEKFLRLSQSNPDMIERIPQNLIASYLGIAPETLSRIRKNIAMRK